MDTQPFYLPWVGDNYAASSPKVLVLGESHYKRDGFDRNTFTQEVIRSWAVGEQGSTKFFTTIAKVLSGKLNEGISKADKAEFWNSVAFYNFVQESVGDGPRDRPSEDMWKQAQQPFVQVMKDLSPNIVVVLGGHLCYHVEQVESQFPTTKFCHWYHPSSFGKFKKDEARATYDKAHQEWLNQRE
jgi:hypothetical protein